MIVHPRSVLICIFAVLLAGLLPAPAEAQVRRPGSFPGATPNPPPSPPVLKLRYEDGQVTAELRDAPLPRVLEELAARTGVVFEIGTHDISPLSLRLYRVPLAEAIQRIVGANNAIYYYEPDVAGHPRMTFVRVIAKTTKPAQPSLRYIGTGEITRTGDEAVETPEQALKVLAEGKALDAREKAVDVLVAAKGDVAVRALEAAVADPAPEIRVAAIEGLAALEARNALPAIVKAMKDEHPAVRRSAIDAVALLGDAGNLKDLRPLLKDRDASVAAAAEAAVRTLSAGRP